MAEYFANVIARLIVRYLTLLVVSLAILAGYWIIEDYNAMIEFIKSISDNTFAHIVVWMPFVLSWFNSSETHSGSKYKYDRHNDFKSSSFSSYDTQYNPSTGLPMMGGGIDVSGKAYGQL